MGIDEVARFHHFQLYPSQVPLLDLAIVAWVYYITDGEHSVIEDEET